MSTDVEIVLRSLDLEDHGDGQTDESEKASSSLEGRRASSDRVGRCGLGTAGSGGRVGAAVCASSLGRARARARAAGRVARCGGNGGHGGRLGRCGHSIVGRSILGGGRRSRARA